MLLISTHIKTNCLTKQGHFYVTLVVSLPSSPDKEGETRNGECLPWTEVMHMAKILAGSRFLLLKLLLFQHFKFSYEQL